MRGKRRGQEGNTMVLFAISLSVLVGFSAISVDTGRLYVVRSRLNAATNAAVLAGARALPDQDGAVAAARAVLQRNGLDPDSATYTTAADGQSLEVSVARDEAMTFARVLGFATRTVASRAKAVKGNLSGTTGAAPLGVVQGVYSFGDLVTLKVAASSCCSAPGNFQALALGKQGASMYEYNLANGFSGWLRLNEWIDTETGNMAQPTMRAVQQRLSADPGATYTSYSPSSPRLLRVPVVSPFPNGHGEVQILGFAIFFLESTNMNANDAEVKGRFVRTITEGEINDLAPDNGVQVVKIVN